MILKKKIAKVRQILLKKLGPKGLLEKIPGRMPILQERSSASETDNASKYQSSLKLKNVCKNYTRAICNFILSDVSNMYLEGIAKEFQLDLEEFRGYVRDRREAIKGVNELRGFLIVQSKDSLKTCCFKKTFQKLSETFIKFFSVNWIFSSKLEYKLDYLKCRHKILKGIRDPSLLMSSLI
jgi:hypothetical protein